MEISNELIIAIAVFLAIIAGIIYIVWKTSKESEQVKEIKESEKELKTIEKDVRKLTEPEKKVVGPETKKFKVDLSKLLETIKKLEKDMKVMNELEAKIEAISRSPRIKRAKRAGQIYDLIKEYQAKYNYDIEVVDNVILSVKQEIDHLIVEVSKFPKHKESLTLMQDLRLLAKRLDPIEVFYSA